MRFLRPVVSFVTAFSVFLHATGVARAEEPSPALPASSAVTLTPATLPAAAQVAPGAARNEPTVFVHIDAGPEVELMGGWPDGRWLSFFCTAPCDRAIPWDAEYQLNVEGQRSSSTFLLDASPGQRVVIKVVPASNVPRVAGVVLVVTGVVAVPGGLLLALYGFFGDNGDEAAGGLIALAGVGALVGGAILTQVRGGVGARQAVSAILLPRMPERSDTAVLRAPVWRDLVKDGATGGAARVGIPIFSRSF